LSPPATRKGALRRAGEERKMPERAGEIDAPKERAMDVTPDAAERSSGATTAMV
jgi:hypothetical protein